MIHRIIKLSWAYILGHNKIFLFALLAGFLLSLFFVKFLRPYLATRPREEIIGRSGNYTLQTLPLDIQEKLSLGLTKTLPDGSATSSAAISWTATDSGKTYIFKLNSNLLWHDGKNLTSSDINYQLQDVKITPQGPEVIKFNLADAFSPLPVVVSQPIFRSGLIGLGEYKLKSIKLSGRFLDSLVLEKPGQLQIYKFFTTDKMAVTALRLGKVQKLEGIQDLTNELNLLSKPDVNYNQQVAIFFDTTSDAVNEKSFRQILAYSLPQNTWDGVQSFGPFSPISWAYNPNLKKYPPKTQASQSAKITLTTVPQLINTASKIKTAWEKIGVEVAINTSEGIPESYQALLMFFEIPKDPDQYLLWHSTSPQNITNYKSPKSDKLLEEGRQTSDPEIRKTKYFEFQKAITEDLPAIFLYFPTMYTVTRK